MNRLERAKSKRKIHRGTITKLLYKVKDILDDEDEDLIKMQQFSTMLKQKSEVLKGLDEEIFHILIEDTDEEDCEKALEEGREIQENVNYYLIKQTSALKKADAEEMSEKEEVESTQVLFRASSHENLCSKASTSSDIVTEIRGRRVKLPKLELKRFGRRISDWQEFWDGCKSAVHDDSEFAKVDKFKYLRSYLEEPARSVVTGFALTEADCDAAIELLKARYAKPSVIKRAHIDDLLNLNPVFHEKNVTRLRNLHDQIETRYRAMETQRKLVTRSPIQVLLYLY
eukprot:gene3851-biopygen3280